MKNPGFTIETVWVGSHFGCLLGGYPDLACEEYEGPMSAIMAFMRHKKADWNDVLLVSELQAIAPRNPEIVDTILHCTVELWALEEFAKYRLIDWVETGISFRVTEQFVELCRPRQFETIQKPVYSHPHPLAVWLGGLVGIELQSKQIGERPEYRWIKEPLPAT